VSDPTTVILTVLKEHEETVSDIYREKVWESVPCKAGCFALLFDDVNYGELPYLGLLESRGIAYNSSWRQGNEYYEGTRYCRFSPQGRLVVKEIYANQLNPQFQPLLEALQIEDPAHRLAALTRLLLHHQEFIHVLPWEGQLEHGQLYRTRQLIGII
jgi:hypothetical protein